MLFSLPTTAALISAALTGVSAAPTSTRATSSFSVPAIHKGIPRNGTASMQKAIARWGRKTVSRRQDGSVPAATQNGDAEYICPVSIGTPAQTLNLDFDTGSADLWVISDQISSSQRGSHAYYTSSQSSTWQVLNGYSWSITYLDQSGAKGDVGTDTVTIGGTTVTSQAVEPATSASASFLSGPNDGLVGLAFSSINTVQPQSQSTFFENAASSLSAPQFAAYLPHLADGAYDFGATDSSKFSGSISYTSVDSSNGFWEFPSTSYSVGGQSYSRSGTGIADTGTTLILMDADSVTNYYNAVSGASYDNNQQGYTFPCGTSLPDLSVAIGDNTATISGSLMSFSTTDSSGQTCYGSLQPNPDTSSQQAIYGDVFFNAYYTVFSSNGPQLGIAPAA